MAASAPPRSAHRARRRWCSASAQRWFAPGFVDREPDRGRRLLHALRDADDEGYAWPATRSPHSTSATGSATITVPLLVAGGEHDQVRAPDLLARDDGGPPERDVEVVRRAGTCRPPRYPSAVAQLLQLRPGAARRETSVTDVYDEGMAVRREVLGDAYVDRAEAATHRPHCGTSRSSSPSTRGARSGPGRGSTGGCALAITLTALIARGHRDELALHVRAARTNGLTAEEIGEVILQTRDLLRSARRQPRRSRSPSRSSRRRQSDELTPSSTTRSRTPFGRYGGALAGVRPDDLAALAVADVLDTAPGAGPGAVDEIVSATPTARARTTATSAGWRGCSPGCRCPCRRRPSTGCAARASTRR